MRVSVRLPKDLHERLKRQADELDMPLGRYIAAVIRDRLG